jgi:hypothetical protein
MWRISSEVSSRTLTGAVLEVANERGVSERTVWRWLAKARAKADDSALTRETYVDDDFAPLLGRGKCAECGGSLPERATSGRRYCDEHATSAARVRRHRRNRAR